MTKTKIFPKKIFSLKKGFFKILKPTPCFWPKSPKKYSKMNFQKKKFFGQNFCPDPLSGPTVAQWDRPQCGHSAAISCPLEVGCPTVAGSCQLSSATVGEVVPHWTGGGRTMAGAPQVVAALWPCSGRCHADDSRAVAGVQRVVAAQWPVSCRPWPHCGRCPADRGRVVAGVVWVGCKIQCSLSEMWQILAALWPMSCRSWPCSGRCPVSRPQWLAVLWPVSCGSWPHSGRCPVSRPSAMLWLVSWCWVAKYSVLCPNCGRSWPRCGRCPAGHGRVVAGVLCPDHNGWPCCGRCPANRGRTVAGVLWPDHNGWPCCGRCPAGCGRIVAGVVWVLGCKIQRS